MLPPASPMGRGLCILGFKSLAPGIGDNYTAQIGCEMVQGHFVWHTLPHEVDVDLGIMDPDYVNIVFNGHQPWAGVATLQKAKTPQVQDQAKAAGVKGLRVVGS